MNRDGYDPRRRPSNPRKERARRATSRRENGRDRSRSRSPADDSNGDDGRNGERGDPLPENGGGRIAATPAAAVAATQSKDDKDDNDPEAARRARMARLRAEMEEEEAKLTQLAAASSRERQIASAKDSIVQVDAAQLAGLDEDEQMRLMLGFSGEFGTTKNQKVDDNHKTSAKGAAAKHKERKYRQYMNRKNGFNRPLDKMD
jgi:U4/U6.U5 tri-snRNP-associated protein 3